MSGMLEACVASALRNRTAFCKFITPNDTGVTGSHQAGYHIGKRAWKFFFDAVGVKGANQERFLTIHWYGVCDTASRAIYYGVGTRNEYRLTRFGNGFPWLAEDHIGDLLVMTRIEDGEYDGFVLEDPEDINAFLETFDIPVNETNSVFDLRELPGGQLRIDYTSPIPPLPSEDVLFAKWIAIWNAKFPKAAEISAAARGIVTEVRVLPSGASADERLVTWNATEYRLFRRLEDTYYAEDLAKPFVSVQALVTFASSLLNSRKSRAGKALEDHLDMLFQMAKLTYDHPGSTENKKKPDFLFPSSAAYANYPRNSSCLVVLGAKTTCKDRWRQVLDEAEHVPVKHLCTLQPTVSKAQLNQMIQAKVVLIVPQMYIKSYPPAPDGTILSVKDFIAFVQEKQAR